MQRETCRWSGKADAYEWRSPDVTLVVLFATSDLQGARGACSFLIGALGRAARRRFRCYNLRNVHPRSDHLRSSQIMVAATSTAELRRWLCGVIDWMFSSSHVSAPNFFTRFLPVFSVEEPIWCEIGPRSGRGQTRSGRGQPRSGRGQMDGKSGAAWQVALEMAGREGQRPWAQGGVMVSRTTLIDCAVSEGAKLTAQATSTGRLSTVTEEIFFFFASSTEITIS